MRLELEANTLDDNTDGNENCPWNGRIKATLGIYVTVVCLRMQIYKSIRYRTC